MDVLSFRPVAHEQFSDKLLPSGGPEGATDGPTRLRARARRVHPDQLAPGAARRWRLPPAAIADPSRRRPGRALPRLGRRRRRPRALVLRHRTDPRLAPAG